MAVKATDLRLKTSLDRAKMIISVKRAIEDCSSISEVATKLKINRRTVTKYLKEPVPELHYSPLNRLISLIIMRYNTRGIKDILKELGYNWKSSREPQYLIARALTKLWEQPDISFTLVEQSPAAKHSPLNCFPGHRFESKYIQRLIANELPVKELLSGVLITQKSFLSDNLAFFKELVRAHPDKKPKELRNEALFCLWYVFGYRAIHWIQSVDQKNLRWHIHKIRTSSLL